MFEEHYSELGYLINEIAEIVITALPENILMPPLCCEKDIDRIREGFILRKQISADASNAPKVTEWLSKDDHARQKYADSIMDVYFMDYHPIQSDTPVTVEYFLSIINSPDSEYLLMVSISYLSFVGLIWLTNHLGEQVERFQTDLIGVTHIKSDTSSIIKLLRIFSLRFISESNPISIRLKTDYMECLETCWQPFRMEKLVALVNEQLISLEKITEWIDANNNAIRDRRISQAAFVLTVVSIPAVVAQLVAIFDVHSQFSGPERIMIIIVVSLIVGVLTLLGAFLFFPRKKPRWNK